MEVHPLPSTSPRVAKPQDVTVEDVEVHTAAVCPGFMKRYRSRPGIALASGAVDVIFWSQGANFDNWSDASSEDRPEGTIATESYLTTPNLYVVLDSSPLAVILEPWE